MKKKPTCETWNEFMSRAKVNGLSPTMQEAIDREEENKDHGFNSNFKNLANKRKEQE